MTEKLNVTIYVAWNEDGSAEASDDRDSALERCADNHGGLRIQVVALNLTVPAPRDLDAEVSITVDESKAEVAEAE